MKLQTITNVTIDVDVKDVVARVTSWKAVVIERDTAPWAHHDELCLVAEIQVKGGEVTDTRDLQCMSPSYIAQHTVSELRADLRS